MSSLNVVAEYHLVGNAPPMSWGRRILSSLPVLGTFINLGLCFSSCPHTREMRIHHIKYLGISLLTTSALLISLTFSKTMQDLFGKNFLVEGFVITLITGSSLHGWASIQEYYLRQEQNPNPNVVQIESISQTNP